MRAICSFLVVCLAALAAEAGQSVAPRAMVATASSYASQAALQAMRNGGSAVDAAIAAALVLAVVEPQSSGLGGGGFATLYLAKNKEVRCLDFRERAPVLAHRDLYLRNGVARPDLSSSGALSVGVPGEVAGLFALHERYGKRPIKELFADAIRLAEQGFTVSSRLALAFKKEQAKLERFDSTTESWRRNGKFPEVGDLWQQPDLAKTLKLLRDKGKTAFYHGDLAKKLFAEVVNRGGILSLVDLGEYEPKWREAVTATYRGFVVHSMPPPSSGGVHLAEMLNVMEYAEVASLGFRSAELLHLAIEAMRRAYADRAAYLGDPSFTSVPLDALTSKDYARKLYDQLPRGRASKADEVKPGLPEAAREPANTTHLSVVDAEGNAVSLTTTVNGPFGSGLVVGGTGVLLNNQMDDFAIAPGVPNAYGLVGADANSVAPRKTPLSSMAPTVVTSDGQLRWALGAPGGATIITTIFWALIHLIDFKADVYSAIVQPRVHQQWKPDTVAIEFFGLDAATVKALTGLGHKLQFKEAWGNAQIVGVLPDGTRVGASDPRYDGAALGY